MSNDLMLDSHDMDSVLLEETWTGNPEIDLGAQEDDAYDFSQDQTDDNKTLDEATDDFCDHCDPIEEANKKLNEIEKTYGYTSIFPSFQ